MSLTRRLFSPFKRQVPTSAYVYMPPKHTWWKAIAAFAAGGICVFALLGGCRVAGIVPPTSIFGCAHRIDPDANGRCNGSHTATRGHAHYRGKCQGQCQANGCPFRASSDGQETPV